MNNFHCNLVLKFTLYLFKVKCRLKEIFNLSIARCKEVISNLNNVKKFIEETQFNSNYLQLIIQQKYSYLLFS